MKIPYELETRYACPKCGDTHLIGVEVDYRIYLPECTNCGYSGGIPEFIMVGEEQR